MNIQSTKITTGQGINSPITFTETEIIQPQRLNRQHLSLI